MGLVLVLWTALIIGRTTIAAGADAFDRERSFPARNFMC
jgi:hypothetical protein